MLSKVFIFVAGAAIGSVATWKFVKTKYEQIAEEEIESMREYYHGKLNNLADEAGERAAEGFEDGLDNPKEENKEKAAEEAMSAMADYRKYASVYKSNDEKEEEDEMKNKPYVISPTEFGEAGYEQVSLRYYADGVLVYDEDDEPVEDIDDLVGEESLKHFGEYEDDSVFVRDDVHKVDFEILKDLGNYRGE